MNSLPFEPDRVKGVIFDAFGTVVRIGDKKRPYRLLLDAAARMGRTPRKEDVPALMSMNFGLAAAAAWMGVQLPLQEITEIEQALFEELATVTPFAEVSPTLAQLRTAGFTIGLCSNLAEPYAAPIHCVLPEAFDAYVWSFEVGSVKPEDAIYSVACFMTGCAPHELLFVGDTYAADVEGPRRFGMQAIHLARDGKSPEPMCLRSIDELVPLLLNH